MSSTRTKQNKKLERTPTVIAVTPTAITKKPTLKRKRTQSVPETPEEFDDHPTTSKPTDKRKKRKIATTSPSPKPELEEGEIEEPITRMEAILSTYSKQNEVEDDNGVISKGKPRRMGSKEKQTNKEITPNKTLHKNTNKWFKKTKSLPDKLGSSKTITTTTTTNETTKTKTPTNVEKRTLILDEDFASSGRKPWDELRKSSKLVHPIDAESSSVSGEDSDVERTIEDDFETRGDETSYDDEEGAFVRFTPTSTESELLDQAKKGQSQMMQSRALQALMRIGEFIHCEDITQDPLTNKNYSDPNKTEKDFFTKTDREKYVETAGNDWINEDFASFFQDTETMVALEEYEECEKALERKDSEAKTETCDLPKVSSKYVADFLREPIEELGERPCIAGDQCVSLYLYRFFKNSASLVPKSGLNSTTPNATSTSSVDTDVSSGNKAPSWKKTTTTHSANLVKTAKRQEGFILREFLLPAQKEAVEMKCQLGVDLKVALEKIERRHCILCNRYFTTNKANRISAGLSKLPKNTIQDHRNFFNCTGEYDLKSLLKPSDGYCGIIGEFVKFNIADYLPALIKEFKFVPKVFTDREDPFVFREPIIREDVGIWVERNCVNAARTHEEGK